MSYKLRSFYCVCVCVAAYTQSDKSCVNVFQCYCEMMMWLKDGGCVLCSRMKVVCVVRDGDCVMCCV